MSKKHLIPCVLGLLVLSGCSTPLIEKAPEKEVTETEDNTPWGEIDESVVTWGDVEQDSGMVAQPDNAATEVEKDKDALPYQTVSVDSKKEKEITESDGSFETTIVYQPKDGDSGTRYVKVTNVTDKNIGGIVKINFIDSEGSLMESESEYIEALTPGNSVIVDFYCSYDNCAKTEILSVKDKLYGTPVNVEISSTLTAEGRPYIAVKNILDKPIFVGVGQVICYKDGEVVSVVRANPQPYSYLEPYMYDECEFGILPQMDEFEVYFQPILVDTRTDYFQDYQKQQ